MNGLDDEQQAALRKFKHDVLGVAPEMPVVPSTTPSMLRLSGQQQRTSRSKSAPGNRPLKNARPSVLFSDIVKETRVPWQDLVRESREAGNPTPGRTRLFDEEAEYLRRWAGEAATTSETSASCQR